MSGYDQGYSDGERDADPERHERVGMGCIALALLVLAPVLWPVGSAITAASVYGLYRFGYLLIPFLDWRAEPLAIAGVVFFAAAGLRVERHLEGYGRYWLGRHVYRLLAMFGLAVHVQVLSAQDNLSFNSPAPCSSPS